MTRKTKREQVADLVKMFGGAARGKTTAEVIDELEAVYDPSDGIAPATATLDDDDIIDVFGREG
jgi:hypothetical protein